jgi:hypothetical protein
MPLPDAEPPDQSRLYEELKSKTALPGASGAITADLIDNLKNATFLDSDNEDQLRRLVLLMQATGAGSTSGPMPDTHVIYNVSGSTSTVSTEFFRPGVGEVWKLLGAATGGQTTNGNSINYTLTVAPKGLTGTAPLGQGVAWVTASSASTGFFPFAETGTEDDVYVTEDYPLYLYVSFSGTADYNVNASFIRVR